MLSSVFVAAAPIRISFAAPVRAVLRVYTLVPLEPARVKVSPSAAVPYSYAVLLNEASPMIGR